MIHRIFLTDGTELSPNLVPQEGEIWKWIGTGTLVKITWVSIYGRKSCMGICDRGCKYLILQDDLISFLTNTYTMSLVKSA